MSVYDSQQPPKSAHSFNKYWFFFVLHQQISYMLGISGLEKKKKRQNSYSRREIQAKEIAKSKPLRLEISFVWNKTEQKWSECGSSK